ncbi:RNA polymerase sigma factor [Rubrimonas cliftonensis]|uniref:RNA polymerase sigma-70 factor, ECF subfamily n=1 Tax=Rubrimonas cliftonensis TaxID=89524 RepID=A0A1H4BRF3_9RHOB|nr:RNA polymerase sigma factor [Rubrimonas cliftonensis]SEA50647.1 RNA polymerase sigma-70 factor, ECF subfamily [Rubrimonas cliftonensis]
MTEDVREQIAALTPRLRRFAWALTGSRDEGDDLVQAGCLKALGALAQYEPGTRLDAWMFRILRTGWIDRARYRARRPQISDPETLEALSDGGVGAREAQARLDLARVRAMMADLPDEQREVLSLVAIEGLSYREAAEVIGAPVGTVMSRLSRARARLTAMMEGEA